MELCGGGEGCKRLQTFIIPTKFVISLLPPSATFHLVDIVGRGEDARDVGVFRRGNSFVYDS